MTASTVESIDTLLSARWVAPVVPADTLWEDYAIAIDGARIVAVCPRREAQQRFKPRQSIDLAEHILLPGLVNAHGHTGMSLFKGMADDKPLEAWLEQDVWPAEQQWVSKEFVRDGAELAIAEMLMSGTTCFSDMYFFPDSVAEAALDAGIRCQLAFPILDFPTVWGNGPDHYIAMGTELFDRYKNHALVNIAFGPHAPYTVARKQLERIAMLSEEMQAAVQMHVHESAVEIQQYQSSQGARPLRLLRDIGLLNPRMQCVHACNLNEDDIEDLSTTASHIIHCPESNLKLASGMCPVAELTHAGVNVALGTDSAASNNDLDMLGEMRSAALLAKGVAGDAAAVPAFKALELATINGARALGLEQDIGSLEVGKLADVIAIDLGDLRLQPIYNPVSQLVYNQLSDQVRHAWIAGKQVLEDRRLCNLDVESIAHRTRQWSQKISASR